MAGSGQSRTGAIYMISDRSATFNTSIPINRQSIPEFALHEGMGALGFNDEHYDLSLSLSTINKLKQKSGDSNAAIEALSRRFQKELEIRKKDQIYKSGKGGVTSVGGGGDPADIEIKSLVLDVLSQLTMRAAGNSDLTEKFQNIIIQILNADFENDTDTTSTVAHFKIENNQEVILVPYTQWVGATYIANQNPSSPYPNQFKRSVLKSILDHFLKDLM